MKTITPSLPNTKVRAIFNSFNTEPGFDFLIIYNGPNTSSPVLYHGSGTNSPGNIVSTHRLGALTFKFTSDGSINSSGWSATISCEAFLETEEKTISVFRYYPNPVNHFLNIDSNVKIEKYQVFDMAGNKILENLVNSKNFKIDFEKCVSGNYIVLLKTENDEVKNLKILKK